MFLKILQILGHFVPVNRIIDYDIKGAITKDILVRETESDDELKQLLEDVSRGKLSNQLRGSSYAKVFDELTACDGVLLKSDRVVIPQKLTSVTHALIDNCISQPFQIRFKWDKKQTWSSRIVKLNYLQGLF